MLLRILLSLLVLSPSIVYGEDIIVHSGHASTIPVNPRSGTLIEFPKSIRVIGDSSYFRIKEVVTSVAKKSGKAVNVRIVKVKPKRSGSVETIPFILSGKKSFSIRFVSMEGAAKHHRIRFPSKRRPQAQIPGASNSFLSTEIDLMRKMLLDEEGGGFSRKVMVKELDIEGYGDKLDMAIVRRFEGQGLTGYTFKLENITDEKLVINPQSLNLGTPNRAVLLHIDHEVLQPCSKNNSIDPKSDSCVTALRLVLRDEGYVQPSTGWDLPFSVNRGSK